MTVGANKNYQLWQTVSGQEDAPLASYSGTKQEAINMFDGQFLDWRKHKKYYMTENGQKIIP